MKVKSRVPKRLRPPQRYGMFKPRHVITNVKRSATSDGSYYFGVAGSYRFPKWGEWYWSPMGAAVLCLYMKGFPKKRVILERIQGLK